MSLTEWLFQSYKLSIHYDDANLYLEDILTNLNSVGLRPHKIRLHITEHVLGQIEPVGFLPAVLTYRSKGQRDMASMLLTKWLWAKKKRNGQIGGK